MVSKQVRGGNMFLISRSQLKYGIRRVKDVKIYKWHYTTQSTAVHWLDVGWRNWMVVMPPGSIHTPTDLY